MPHTLINPESLGAPKGYSNGVLAPASGQLLFVAGQVGWNDRQEIVSDDFAAQFGQALRNIREVVGAAGGRVTDVVRFTVFVSDKREYLRSLKEVGDCYRAVMGKHFPAMSLLQVQDLLEKGAKVEIEATAVIG